MIIDTGNFSIAVETDVPGAQLDGLSHASGGFPTDGTSVDVARRAVVEARRRVGGLPQHALLGGVMHPPKSPGRLHVEVTLTGAMSTDPATDPPSRSFLLGPELTPGLPQEFGGGALSGLLGSAVRSGFVSIDRGAYHPVESSHVSFSMAGSVLMVVLQTENRADIEARVRTLLEILSSAGRLRDTRLG